MTYVSIEQAVERLRKELAENPQFCQAYRDSIAVCVYEEHKEFCKERDVRINPNVGAIVTRGVDRFITKFIHKEQV